LITLTDMKEAEKLSSLIKKGENRSAAAFIESILTQIPCQEYAQCLVRVTLIKTVELLNDTVEGFYCNAAEFAEKIFSQPQFDAEGIINELCSIMKEARMVDKERCFLKAEEYIRKNFSDSTFYVENAARHTGVSQSFLNRLFCEKLGMPPGEYAARLRIEKSKELLEKDVTVAEVAQKVGFCAVETYIRTFKRYCGTTPGVWKRNNLFL